MLHACRRASAFISRFKTWERRFILTHFIESIQSEMESLLDCYGNRWGKKAVSLRLCLCARPSLVKRQRGTPLQV